MGRRSGSDLLIDVENILGSSAADHLRGDDARNQIAGGAGNDVIEGRGAPDTLLGEDGVRDAIKDQDLQGHPHDLAVGAEDPDIATLEKITAEVTQALVTRVGGKNATLTITRRVPIIGGAISAGVDALATHSVGRYADREFPPHVMIERA